MSLERVPAIRQNGYPPHDRPMRVSTNPIPHPPVMRKECNHALVLPEQGGVKGRYPYLYCTGCKILLVGSDEQIRSANKAATAEGFDPTAQATVPLPNPPKPDKSPVPRTIPMFDFEPRVGRNGTVR